MTEHLLDPYLAPGKSLRAHERYFEAPIEHSTPGLQANAHYFSHPDWAREYLDFVHRSETFRDRWLAATGPWDGKIVVDVGCGPGNVHATLGSKPAVLIGVDVAPGSLLLAVEQGYVGVLADGQHLPFKDAFADIVVVNASLHHCDDMQAALREAARMVKAGGILVTDHDPQLTAWDFKGIAKLLWNARIWVYRLTGHSFHKSSVQQASGLRTELHHKPGHGVDDALYRKVLEPMGFEVSVFAHNHESGAEVLQGDWGKAVWKYRVGQRLSGRNPRSRESALSLMCVARRNALQDLQ